MLGMVGGLSAFIVDFSLDILSDYRKVDQIAISFDGHFNTNQHATLKISLFKSIKFHVRILGLVILPIPFF